MKVLIVLVDQSRHAVEPETKEVASYGTAALVGAGAVGADGRRAGAVAARDTGQPP
jgi:hypothetical protein